MNKVWFVTGASRGFGREFALAALQRGDRVAATARRVSALDDIAQRFGDRFVALQLDVTDRAADFEAVRRAHEAFGRLDVVVNNAGYGHFGAFEELSEAELRDQLETNFFGAVWVTQAALPILRAQRSGHIIQISSVGGLLAFPYMSAYHASKWALEAISESLAAEVAPAGVNVTLVEPSVFGTDWAGSSARRSTPMPDYDHVRMIDQRRRGGIHPGDAKAAAQALLEIVDAEKPPLRVLFGNDALERVTAAYDRRLQNWQEWQHVAKRAAG
jgi:NAD(P)-dependent dehydrogenase (short-subunit alcohol dehydrogenase family)